MIDQNEDILSKLGIDISHDKINIDINKTRGFFNTLQTTLQSKAETLEKNFSEGKVDMSESAGIKIDKEHIDIDLAKTKSFLEELGKKVEDFAGEVDKAVDQIGLNKPENSEQATKDASSTL